MASNNVLNKLKKFSDEERNEMKEKFADVSINSMYRCMIFMS